MANIKSLLGKILIPVAIAYCIAAIITLNIVSQSVTRLTTEVLTARSEAASYSVGENFTKYMEIAKQMAADSSFEELFLKTQPGMAMTSVVAIRDFIINGVIWLFFPANLGRGRFPREHAAFGWHVSLVSKVLRICDIIYWWELCAFILSLNSFVGLTKKCVNNIVISRTKKRRGYK